MFEADKDCVYLDYGAVTIVDKVGKISTVGASGSTKEEAEAAKNPQTKGSAKEVSSHDYMNQVGAWEIKQFADASHITGLGVAML